MQSSPKKGKLATALRSVQLEQISKLNLKHQHETDLLEDIRLFAKQRSAIEKSYGEALLKLSTMLLQRKIPTINDVASDDGRDRKSVYSVWRMVLEENEKLSKARLAAAEVFHQQISESSKSVRAHKMQVNKKCLEQLQRIQDEILKSTRELDKAKKSYSDEEHVAHDVRDKAQEAEERLKKKKGHFFQSFSSLQKNSNKIANRKEVCDNKSLDARNEYLLNLVTVNAHQTRYHDIDLPEIMKMMDVDMYEKTAEYFQLLSQTELFTCAATQTSFTKIKEVADLVTRQHNLKCYLNEWTALRDGIQYQFEPCDGDKIECVVENAVMSLSMEAKTSAARIAKETRSIRNYQKQLKSLLSQQQVGSSQKEEGAMDQLGVQDLEQKIDELRQNIRKSETSRCKAEARIDLLRQGGVNVEEFMIDLDSLGPSDLGVGELSRAESTLSVRSNASGMDDVSGEYYDSDPNDVADKKPVEDSHSEAQDAGSLYGTQAEADWPAEDEEQRRKSVYSAGETTSQGPLRFVALYSYTAQNSDELSIIEQEILEIVDEGEGDGWVKARNSQGIEGYVPQNYVEIESASEGGHGSMYPAPTSFSSVDYTIPDWGDEDALQPEEIQPEVVETVPRPEVATMEAIEPTIKITEDDAREDGIVVTCRALFDYEANGPEEISFVEGQIIKVTRKFVHSVDDGWWEGEIDGQVGIFPSLVVEELSVDGQLLSPEELLSPTPLSEPPSFAPPPMPQFLSAAAHVIITQPTPDTEYVDEDYYSQNQDKEKDDDQNDDTKDQDDKTDKSGPVSFSYSDPSFEMEMSEEQQLQYQAQFETDNNANETAVSLEGEIKEEQVATEIEELIEEVKEVMEQMETEIEEIKDIEGPMESSDGQRVIPDINLTSASPQKDESPNEVEEGEEAAAENEVEEAPNDVEDPTG